MSYLDQSQIAANPSMSERIAQCVTQEGELEPDTWTYENRREWAAAPGWDDAWASAQASHPPPDPPDPTVPSYDPGADEAVITDAMILGQVQAMRA
jgi:hypothetical protein